MVKSYFVGKGMHEQYWCYIYIAHISVILWGYVLIWYAYRHVKNRKKMYRLAV